MGEFADKTRERAAEALRSRYLQGATSETGPILDLIGSLLEDGAGGVLSPSEVSITTDQWLIWNRLVMEQGDRLLRTMTVILEREGVGLPMEVEAMRNWAASLMLATLDQMEML